MKLNFLLMLLIQGFFASVLTAQECPLPCEQAQNCERQYYLDGGRVTLYTNYPLEQFNDCIEDVIFTVHGTERNPRSRYQAVFDAAKSVGRERNVLIISPYFKTDEDELEYIDIFWSDGGWKQGNTSNDGRAVSSFTVIDRVFKSIVDNQRFVNVGRVTISGHSAGGQFSQMFAVTSGLTQRYPTVDFQFIVLNPSNYTYLNNYRPHPNLDDYFEVPVTRSSSGTLKMKPIYRATAGNCPETYNEYRYGLQDKNNYASRFLNSELIAQYRERHVYYFLGSLDNDPDDDSLDNSCSARLQGFTRLDRGQKYFSFLNTFFPNQHQLGVVEGVGHDARKMYNADNVKQVLFFPSARAKNPVLTTQQMSAKFF